MYRPIVVALVFAALVPVSAAAQASAIDLHISYRASAAATPRVLTLHCDPARGTVVNPGSACRRLRRFLGASAFAPTPRGMLCAQLYGGPMTAIVTGTYEGRPLWTRLARVDGCAIARWNRVGFLFPPTPGAKPGRPPDG